MDVNIKQHPPSPPSPPPVGSPHAAHIQSRGLVSALACFSSAICVRSPHLQHLHRPQLPSSQAAAEV